MLHRSNGVAGTTQNTDYVTTGFWRGQCNGTSIGVTIYSPDGTKYEMTELDGPYWHVKRITDRNGNYFDFTYTSTLMGGWKRVSLISANDGRSVSFSYASGKLTSITGASRTWGYTVNTVGDGGYQL